MVTGTVNGMVNGMGPDAGAPPGRHMDVDAFTVTGSTEAGRRLRNYSARRPLTEVCLEAGNQSAAAAAIPASGRWTAKRCP